MILKKFSFISLMVCLSLYAVGQSASHILLIPLDDRPPCLQFPTKMGLIGDVEMVTPPRELLGRFTDFGKSDEIISWIRSQNLQKFDAVIVSLDMLAYGGLVASRVHETPLKVALERVEIIKEIRQKYPKLKIYGSSVIMRLAPTGDGKNEAYREKLSKWAEVSPYAENKQLTQQLASEIPAQALENYQLARERNLAINRLVVTLAQQQVFDYLILSQDDAKPKGVHIKERESLVESVASNQLESKVAIQPGADEVSMLLLARAVSDKYKYCPRIKAVYSSDQMANKIMPFEDRPLRKTVSFHIKAVGAKEVDNEQEADIFYYVFASRFEKGRASSFADEIVNFTKKHPKKGLIIADVDPKGDVQGGDSTFTEMLQNQAIFSKIYGYACWNTAGNTVGTALPHGILYGASKVMKTNKKQAERMAKAQQWFTLNRLIDDYAYHTLVRPMANQMSRSNQWNSFRLTQEQSQTIEAFCSKNLSPIINKIASRYFGKASPIKITNLNFDLPWSRTFEAEINFDIKP
jgi:Protein of unknown function (DUF4127)